MANNSNSNRALFAPMPSTVAQGASGYSSGLNQTPTGNIKYTGPALPTSVPLKDRISAAAAGPSAGPPAAAPAAHAPPAAHAIPTAHAPPSAPNPPAKKQRSVGSSSTAPNPPPTTSIMPWKASITNASIAVGKKKRIAPGGPITAPPFNIQNSIASSQSNSGTPYAGNSNVQQQPPTISAGGMAAGHNPHNSLNVAGQPAALNQVVQVPLHSSVLTSTSINYPHQTPHVIPAATVPVGSTSITEAGVTDCFYNLDPRVAQELLIWMTYQSNIYNLYISGGCTGHNSTGSGSEPPYIAQRFIVWYEQQQAAYLRFVSKKYPGHQGDILLDTSVYACKPLSPTPVLGLAILTTPRAAPTPPQQNLVLQGDYYSQYQPAQCLVQYQPQCSAVPPSYYQAPAQQPCINPPAGPRFHPGPPPRPRTYRQPTAPIWSSRSGVRTRLVQYPAESIFAPGPRQYPPGDFRNNVMVDVPPPQAATTRYARTAVKDVSRMAATAQPTTSKAQSTDSTTPESANITAHVRQGAGLSQWWRYGGIILLALLLCSDIL